MAFVMDPICNPSHSAWTSEEALRRNISVFSRRGTDSPPPMEQALMSNSMSFALGKTLPGFPSEPPPRVKRWRLSRQKTVAKPVRGTILRAVPQDAPLRRNPTMTALEVEMATSPNDEILRKIGRTPIDEKVMTLPSPLCSPTTPTVAEASTADLSPRRIDARISRREHSQRADDSIIGIWQNGRASWDQTPAAEATSTEVHHTLRRSDTAISTIRRKPAKLAKPSIKVLIPDLSSPLPPFTFEPFDASSVSDGCIRRNKTVTQVATDSIAPMAHTSRPSARRSELQRGSITVSSPASASSKHLQAPAVITTAATSDFESYGVPKPDVLTVRNPNLASSDSSVASGLSDDDSRLSTRSSRTSMNSVSSRDNHSGSEVETTLQRTSTQRLKTRSSRSVRFSSVTNVIDPTTAPTVGRIGTRSHPAELEGPPVVQLAPPLVSMVQVLRRSSVERPVKRLSSRRGNLLLKRMNSRGSARSQSSTRSNSIVSTPLRPSTPTLQQAEDDLETQLRRFSGSSDDSLPPSTANINISDAPAIPQRSPRRTFVAPVVRRRSTKAVRVPAVSKKSSLRKREFSKPTQSSRQEGQVISAQQGMAVVRMIFERLDSLDDLFNTATTNKAFYRVFKRNELAIIKSVLRNMCVAAWECSETKSPISSGADSELDSLASSVMPSGYLNGHRSRTYTIRALKDLILDQCRDIVRPASIEDLQNRDGKCNSAMDNALWRIWTFCRIFGSGRGREDDLVGQMDWLRGGALAHQEQCTGTISANDTLMMSSVLLSAPVHFGRGNGVNGLSAEQLFDILEMWSCLGHITSGMLGRQEQARDYGIFGETERLATCDDREESALLEEFQSYILSLGLVPTLDIATYATSPSPSVFQSAQSHGWTTWSPPTLDGTIPSRKDFLREAVSRLYEERICETFTQPEAKLSHMKSLRKQREIRQSVSVATRRQSLGFVERPTLRIDTANVTHRPASRSRYSLSAGQRASPVPRKTGPGLLRAVSPTKTLRPSSLVVAAQEQVPPHHQPSGRPTLRAVSLDTATSNMPPILPLDTRRMRNASWSPRTTIANEQPAHPSHAPPPPPPAYNASAQRTNEARRSDALVVAESVDRALACIMEMGFTVTQAKGALKITDMGDGLNVGRAVEYLLRLGEGEY